MYIGCSHGHNDSSHAVMLFFFFYRQQSPDQAAWMCRLIWIRCSHEHSDRSENIDCGYSLEPPR